MRIEFGKETAQAGIIEGCWIPLKQTRDHTRPGGELVRTRTEQAGEGAAQAAADRKHACFARPEEKQRCLSVCRDERIPFASRSFGQRRVRRVGRMAAREARLLLFPVPRANLE